MSIPNVHLTKPAPNNMTLFVFSNLHLTPRASWVVQAQQVNQVLVINFDKRTLQIEIPGTTTFFFELLSTRKY